PSSMRSASEFHRRSVENLRRRWRFVFQSPAAKRFGAITARSSAPRPTRSHRHDPLHQPPLLAPEAHIHLSVHRSGGGQILLGLLWLSGAAVELAPGSIGKGD